MGYLLDTKNYLDMNDIESFFKERISTITPGFVSVQISGPEAVSILESIYEKGRADSEKEIRTAIEKEQKETIISKAEAMKLLQKSENCLWKWNRRGFLKAIKQGGTVKYRLSDVMAIVKGESALCPRIKMR